MQITAVTLRRGGSRGFSPAYEVTLRADGSADWNGERFVLRIGRFYGQFDVRNFAKLAMFVARAGFFGWKDEYSSGGTDAPDYELAVAAGMRTKQVRQNGTDEPPTFGSWQPSWTGSRRRLSGGPMRPPGCAANGLRLSRRSGLWDRSYPSRAFATFPTGGYKVELRRHEPQSGDQRTLLLDRVVTDRPTQ